MCETTRELLSNIWLAHWNMRKSLISRTWFELNDKFNMDLIAEVDSHM